MYKEALRPAWVEIDLKKFDRNIKNIIAKAAPAEVIGVVKADGYGHGAIQCAQVLRENGIKSFAVATLSEAIRLRNAGAEEEIVMLGLTPDMYGDDIVKWNITPVVCDSLNAKAINDAAEKANKKLDVFIAVDTGMGRIGYLYDDVENAVFDIKKIAMLPNIKIKGLFSHMATADAADKTFSLEQEKRFNDFHSALISFGLDIPVKTLGNSASIMELPSIHFDYVRPGIILYGCYPSREVDRSLLEIQEIMSVKANIVHIKDVPPGFSCGYGRKYIADRPSRIATIPLGYADGYPRLFSARAKVIVNGIICPVAGNICMDQFMVDITEAPDVKVGDEVIIMGSDGVNTISSEDIAEATGTINYEVCCGFGQRLPKVYVK